MALGKRYMLAAVFAACAWAAPGCNIVAPAYLAIHGPEKVEPRFTLDPSLTTVIFVDDPASKVGRRRLRGEIGTAASEILLRRGLATDIIDPNAALLAASKERHGEPMSVTEIGQAVEADIVIYVLLTEFTLSADGQTNLPACTMSVKIIDARTSERVWPVEGDGSVVRIRPTQRVGQRATNRGDVAKQERELAARAGLGLAQIFYKHEIQESALR